MQIRHKITDKILWEDPARHNLRKANLYYADLRKANLRGANLRGANLRGANLRDADLSEADLRGAVLSGADLSGADLRGADLHGADLCDADLYYADLRKANLRGAVLSGADLCGAELCKADLRGADLCEADLRGAELYNASFGRVPTIKNIHQAVLQAVEAEGHSLDMDRWHTCETTHCRAGWIIRLSGVAGAKLESLLSTKTAAALIYQASDPMLRKIPSFYDTNEEAMIDIRKSADKERRKSPKAK